MISDWLPFKDKHITNISRGMARAIFWIYIFNALILLQKVFEKKIGIYLKRIETWCSWYVRIEICAVWTRGQPLLWHICILLLLFSHANNVLTLTWSFKLFFIIWVPLENFREKKILPRKPALLFCPSTWNTIGLFCKPPPGMGDQKVRKGPSPSILRTTIGKSWHCQNWRSTTPPIPEFWHKVGFGDKKSVTCDN